VLAREVGRAAGGVGSSVPALDVGTIILVMTVTSLASVKAQLSAFVESVSTTHERVVITRNGEPAAVLISPDDLEALEETIAILSDPAAMADIEEARRAISQGDLVDSADITLRHRS
jgi:antitoxin YefM